MVAMESMNNQYLGGDSSLSCSFETQTLLDKKVVRAGRRQHEKAYKILEDNIEKLHWNWRNICIGMKQSQARNL